MGEARKITSISGHQSSSFQTLNWKNQSLGPGLGSPLWALMQVWSTEAPSDEDKCDEHWGFQKSLKRSGYWIHIRKQARIFGRKEKWLKKLIQGRVNWVWWQMRLLGHGESHNPGDVGIRRENNRYFMN